MKKQKTIGGYLIGLGLRGCWGELGRVKKQMHLIYSSIRMEINGLCLSDTPPLSTLTFFFFPTTGILSAASVKWTPAGTSCPTVVVKHCHPHIFKWYDNTFKDKKDNHSSENPWSQKCRCETRLEQFVYEEDGLRCRSAAVKFYRAHSGVQYGRHDATACLCPSPNETGGFALGFIGCLLTF